jgi:hypothetical protein
MNWFGLFTCTSIVVAIVGYLAYEFGYERAIKDISVSKNWCLERRK